MLETENTIRVEDVVAEIMATNIMKTSKIKLLKRIKSYEGFNDNFSFIDKEIEKVKKPYNSCK